MTDQTPTAMTRITYALVGGLVGICSWVLVDVVPDVIDNGHAVLLLISGGLGAFAVLLGLMGPVRLWVAGAAASGMAALASLLLLAASFRFETTSELISGGYAIAAFVYLLTISVPFAVARLQHHGGWRHYGLLFDAAWDLVVRIASASLFVGAAWTVLMLSDLLLGLVGLTVIQDVIEWPPFPFLFSGIALGLSLAIVHELRDYVSPFLIIQLLRLFLPALLAVLAIFIAALPFRGLGDLFGQFSAAAILMGVTFAGITLVTTAIHRDDTQAADGPLMRGATKALSVLLPAPALLALWAVWLRVDQYGLTPHRIAALVAAAVLSLYAVAYAVAVLRGPNWRNAQRQVNRGMAVLTLGVAALWLTPVLNAERMSTASQLDRAERGPPPGNLPLREMAQDWGKAGQRGLARLEAAAQDDPDMLAQISQARGGPGSDDYAEGEDRQAVPLDQMVPLRPEGARLPEGALETLGFADRLMIREACAQVAPGGHPGCVMVRGPSWPNGDAEHVTGFFMTSETGLRIVSFEMRGQILTAGSLPRVLATGDPAAAGPEIIGDVLDGRFSFVPVERRVLEVNGMRLGP